MHAAPNLVTRALDALRPLGIDGHALSDDRVCLTRGAHTCTFAVHTAAVVRPSNVALVAERHRALPAPALLIAAHVSAETAALLRARGLAFVDAVGNAHLATPDLLIEISGRPAPPPPRAPRIGEATLRVMFVLLRTPSAASLPVRALGEQAGVSHGAAATALRDLEARGWVQALGRQGRVVVDRAGLLSAWLHGFADRLAPGLLLAQAAPGGGGVPRWAADVRGRLDPDNELLGGELAAELAGHPLRGVTASLYVRRWDAEVLRRLRLVPSAGGPICVRTAFAPGLGDPAAPGLADPLLVLGELIAIPDPRLDEVRAAMRRALLEGA